MRRTALCLVALALLALPAFAGPSSRGACPAAAALAAPPGLFSAAPTVEPLAASERLFYRLTGLRTDAPLEVQYLIDGRPFVAESLDLAQPQTPRPSGEPTARPPQAPEKTAPLGSGSLALESLAALMGEERVTELLALRPDLVRQLLQREKAGASVSIEVYQGKSRLEALTLPELRERYASLADEAGHRVTPVVVPSRVSGGPRDGKAPTIQSGVRHKYLPNCNDCTTETPCDEECGYDPGKGGPVTCGEFGVCASTCPCSDDAGPTYSGWYYYSTYYSGYNSCLKSNSWGFDRHDERTTVYRRDVYSNTLICPSCPSCAGCYIQQTQTSYQLGYGVPCFEDSGVPCFWGSIACCSTLCSFGNACNWGC